MAVNKFDNSMLDSDAIGTSANQLLQLDSNTKYPAVDGSLLTSIPSPFTASASDPTISTNPSGGVGTLWKNTSSGEMYCCTDATAGANVWTNVGAGTGNVVPFIPYGTNAGFHVGGYNFQNSTPWAYGAVKRISRISFVTDGNATDHGDLALTTPNSYSQAVHGKMHQAGASSETHGYALGGYDTPTTSATVEKFAFATANSAAEVGNLHQRCQYGEHGQSDGSKAFIAGGQYDDTTTISMIQTYTYASDTGADNGNDLDFARKDQSGAQDGTHGYIFAGTNASNAGVTQIDRYALATTVNAIDVGDLTKTKTGQTATTSETKAYVIGGGHAGVDVFSFASGSSSVISTEVFSVQTEGSGQYKNWVGNSAETAGYISSERAFESIPQWPGGSLEIQKIHYASNTTTKDIGDLTKRGNSGSAAQY
jgi:hypothetical protein